MSFLSSNMRLGDLSVDFAAIIQKGHTLERLRQKLPHDSAGRWDAWVLGLERAGTHLPQVSQAWKCPLPSYIPPVTLPALCSFQRCMRVVRTGVSSTSTLLLVQCLLIAATAAALSGKESLSFSFFLKKTCCLDFPGGPVVKTLHFLMQELWVRSLVGELRSPHATQCGQKLKKKKKRPFVYHPVPKAERGLG